MLKQTEFARSSPATGAPSCSGGSRQPLSPENTATSGFIVTPSWQIPTASLSPAGLNASAVKWRPSYVPGSSSVATSSKSEEAVEYSRTCLWFGLPCFPPTASSSREKPRPPGTPPLCGWHAGKSSIAFSSLFVSATRTSTSPVSPPRTDATIELSRLKATSQKGVPDWASHRSSHGGG